MIKLKRILKNWEMKLSKENVKINKKMIICFFIENCCYVFSKENSQKLD